MCIVLNAKNDGVVISLLRLQNEIITNEVFWAALVTLRRRHAGITLDLNKIIFYDWFKPNEITKSSYNSTEEFFFFLDTYYRTLTVSFCFGLFLTNLRQSKYWKKSTRHSYRISRLFLEYCRLF